MITKEDCQEFTSYGVQSKKNLINMYLWADIVDTLSMKITLLLLGGN